MKEKVDANIGEIAYLIHESTLYWIPTSPSVYYLQKSEKFKKLVDLERI